VPAAPLGSEESLTYHDTTLKQLLGDIGYKAKAITEGLAVIYSELQDSNYTASDQLRRRPVQRLRRIPVGAGLQLQHCKAAISSTPAPRRARRSRNSVRIAKRSPSGSTGILPKNLTKCWPCITTT